MAAITAPDLRSGYPRSGRTFLGRYAWLARLADKARAHKAGKAGDYVVYCPVSLGFLERLHIPRQEFEALIDSDYSDEQLADAFDRRVAGNDREAANHWILVENASDLHEQDVEEGRRSS